MQRFNLHRPGLAGAKIESQLEVLISVLIEDDDRRGVLSQSHRICGCIYAAGLQLRLEVCLDKSASRQIPGKLEAKTNWFENILRIESTDGRVERVRMRGNLLWRLALFLEKHISGKK